MAAPLTYEIFMGWTKSAFAAGRISKIEEGKETWDDFKPKVPHHEMGEWRVDAEAIYNEMRGFGVLDKEECPPELFGKHHHFLQLARIAYRSPKPTLLLVCQISYNLGRMALLESRGDMYPENWKQYMEYKKLNNLSTYVHLPYFTGNMLELTIKPRFYWSDDTVFCPRDFR